MVVLVMDSQNNEEKSVSNSLAALHTTFYFVSMLLLFRLDWYPSDVSAPFKNSMTYSAKFINEVNNTKLKIPPRKYPLEPFFIHPTVKKRLH